VAELPLRDRAGNALVDLRFVPEASLVPLVPLAARLPMPLSLVVVTLGEAATGTVLMMLDAWRRQWELPGGTREGGETARQTAVRELGEETGIWAADLAFAAVAEFELGRPGCRRREYAAVYRTALADAPVLTTNDEALDFRWWHPRSSPGEDMSPLDAEIARRVASR
jgi:8-oxo-dGTP diphosphatase